MRTRRTSPRALGAALALAGLAAPVLPAQGAGETGSLESLLEHARAREAEQLEALRPELDRRFAELQAAVVEGRRVPIERARTQLIELGPLAAPLLVQHVDPGDPADPDTRAVAVRVSQVLAELQPGSITDALLDIVRTGTLDGRLNALRVLARSPQPSRVRPVLIELYRRSEGALHSGALTALARLGGDETRALLAEVLHRHDPETVGIALRALADAQAADAADDVLRFMTSSALAPDHVRELLQYYAACPGTLTEAHVDGLIELASRTATPNGDRIALLERIGKHPASVTEAHRERVRKLAAVPASDLHEAALVCLAVLGDRNARRELLDPYDERVERNRSWAKSYENRAQALYRIGDYRDAIRDYKKALDLGAADPRTKQEEAYVGLARCYALSGKLREAAQTLRDAPIGAAELRVLADDPDFAELRASTRYGDVLDVDGGR